MSTHEPQVSGRYRSITFVPLFDAPGDRQAARIVLDAVNPAATCPAAAVVMPRTGIAFFEATGEDARQLDRIWAQVVPGDTCPVVVILHDAKLPTFLDGLDAAFVIGCRDAATAGVYARHPHVQVVPSDDPIRVLHAAMEAWNNPADPCFLPRDPLPNADGPSPPPRDAGRPSLTPQAPNVAPEPETDFFNSIFEERAPVGREIVEPADTTAPWGPLASDEPGITEPAIADSAQGRLQPDPLGALAALRPVTVDRPDPEPKHAPEKVKRRGRAKAVVADAPPDEAVAAEETSTGWLGRARAVFAGRRAIEVPGEIGDLLLGTRPAPLVVVGSRKGGVGKTALSAGLAQVAGYSLDGRAGIAALVDQNINNADQWGRLMLPDGVTTVREIMSQLENGLDFPGAPAYARTPALAVFPESRDPGDGYSALLIQRFCQHLRERFVLTVIDLPNTLPAMTSAEAAVTYSYVEQADLVLVPTTDDPNALRGVIEYLEAPSMRQKAAVVPYIVSTEKGIRDHPKVIDLLDQIRARAVAVVPFPKTEKATLAVVKGTSVLDVDARLRNAYIDLAAVVARILVRTV